MNTFGQYLKHKMGDIILVSFILFLYDIFLVLYQLPLAAIVYPTVIGIVIGCGYLLVDFRKKKKQYDILKGLAEQGSMLIDELPEPTSLQEEQYIELVNSLLREIARADTLAQGKYQNMIEYYTVWVHQVKTPIASMRLTLEQMDSPESRRISSDLFRIEQYVEMVLTFLRLDEGANDYVFRKTEVDTLVRQSVRKFASEFIGRKLRLEYEEIPGTIVTDEKWLGFVLEQILSNALKYTKEGGIKIYKGENNTLCIKDTGIGIAPEDLPRIFEKGYTGYNGRADRKATGLGLYLCKQICTNLGIAITAESKVGEGTVISLQLDQYDLHVE